MISITTKSPYALSALVELHRHGDRGPVPIAELARRREIPVQFLEQLFATLRRAGILRSQRGVKGGYTLRPSRRPRSPCSRSSSCSTARRGRRHRRVRAGAAGRVRSVLADSTVADVAEAEARAATGARCTTSDAAAPGTRAARRRIS